MTKSKIKDFQINQINQIIDYDPIIPLQDENDVRNVYGAPPSIDVIPPLNPKPVDEAITDAGKYIIKMQKKGFIKLQDDIKNPNQIYQSSIMKYNKNKKESEESAQRQKKPEKALEPYQTFWQTSDIVKKTVNELNQLQFENSFEHLEVESRFRDQVASFVRVMNHNGMLEQNNKSRAELMDITKLFVDKVKEIRTNLFKNYLSKNILLYSKLNKKQQKEFIEFKPKNAEPVHQMQIQSAEKLDSTFLNRIRQASTNLPKAYQMTNLGFDDAPLSINHVKLHKEMKQLAASMHSAVDRIPAPIIPNYDEKAEKKNPKDDQSIPRKRVNVIATPKISRKGGNSVLSKRPPLKPIKNPTLDNQSQQLEKSSLPKLTQKQIYNKYWENQDPLAEIRQGFAPNALQIINDLAQKSNKDYMSLFSTSDSESAAQNNDSSNDQNQNVSITQIEDQYESDNPIQLEQIQKEKRRRKVKTNDQASLRDNIFSTSVLNLRLDDEEVAQNSIPFARRNYIFDPKSDDIQYLIQQSADLENGDMSHAIYKRLEAIWENLGFSASQKLQMVIKYSESTEESSKLNSALKFWEEANNSAINYQKAYIALKDFLKYNCISDKDKPTTSIIDLKDKMYESEKNLLQVAKTLKSMFCDDLVFHGKKVDDIIKSRRMKLKVLQQQSDTSKENQNI